MKIFGYKFFDTSEFEIDFFHSLVTFAEGLKNFYIRKWTLICEKKVYPD